MRLPAQMNLRDAGGHGQNSVANAVSDESHERGFGGTVYCSGQQRTAFHPEHQFQQQSSRQRTTVWPTHGQGVAALPASSQAQQQPEDGWRGHCNVAGFTVPVAQLPLGDSSGVGQDSFSGRPGEEPGQRDHAGGGHGAVQQSTPMHSFSGVPGDQRGQGEYAGGGQGGDQWSTPMHAVKAEPEAITGRRQRLRFWPTEEEALAAAAEVASVEPKSFACGPVPGRDGGAAGGQVGSSMAPQTCQQPGGGDGHGQGPHVELAWNERPQVGFGGVVIQEGARSTPVRGDSGVPQESAPQQYSPLGSWPWQEQVRAVASEAGSALEQTMPGFRAPVQVARHDGGQLAGAGAAPHHRERVEGFGDGQDPRSEAADDHRIVGTIGGPAYHAEMRAGLYAKSIQQTTMGSLPAQGQQWAAGVLAGLGHQQASGGSHPQLQYDGLDPGQCTPLQNQYVCFEGHDGVGQKQGQSVGMQSTGGQTPTDVPGPLCQCNQPTAARVTQKEGMNKGRIFFACMCRPQCGFFQWADEPPRQPGQQQGLSVPPVDLPPAPSCYCQQLCTAVCARKEGPNTGRWFFACQKSQSERCGFFAWADEPPKPSGPQCKCGLASKFLVVRKEGPNNGRAFFGCPRPQAQACRFFQWADELSAAQQANMGVVATPLRSMCVGGGGGGKGGIGGGGGHGGYLAESGSSQANVGAKGYGVDKSHGGKARVQHSTREESYEHEAFGGIPGSVVRYGPY